MRKFYSIMVAFAAALSLSAQGTAKVESQEAFDYNRSSLTIIALTGLTNVDATVTEWASHENFGGKFDMNTIQTGHIVAASDPNQIQEKLNQAGVGKQILNYWVQYDGTKFDDSLMKQRARYNATDADVLADAARKVSVLNVANKNSLKNSYVMVAGPTEIVQKTDKKGNVSYSAKVDAYVYLLDLSDETINNIWENWLDSEATTAQRDQYNNIKVDVNLVASTINKLGSGKTPEEAIYGALNNILQPLEKKIDQWQVVTSIYQKHPLGAKIGRKEGLGNSDRYRAYKVVEDADGNLKYKKVGFVRATKVVDNSQDASGNSECSNFYQISGSTLREGMFLKQKKDARIAVSAYGNIGGYSIAGLDIDYLIHTSQALGIMQYGGLSVGMYSGDNEYDKSSTWVNAALNYGIGIHPVRIIEITPNIGVGADYYIADKDQKTDDDSFSKKLAYFARGGVKVGFQVWYPVQIFVRADYSYQFSKGDLYVEADKERFGKLSFGAGVKVNF